MTAAESVQGEAPPLAGAVSFHSFGCVLGTAWKKAATAAEHRADRISVEAYQRKQHWFHRIMVEMKWPCSTNPGFPAPWLAGQELMVWPPGEARNRLSEAGNASGGTALWPVFGQGFDPPIGAGSAWRRPGQAALRGILQRYAGGNVAGNAGSSAPF